MCPKKEKKRINHVGYIPATILCFFFVFVDDRFPLKDIRLFMLEKSNTAITSENGNILSTLYHQTLKVPIIYKNQL